MTLAARVRSYVHRHHVTLAQQFEWRLNASTLATHLGLAVTGPTSFDRNIDLKLQLAALWANSSLNVRRRIARYYVVAWGGIKRNDPARLNGYVSAAATGTVPPPRGIASWSKILAASDPMQHAIFDARVALALNVLQLRPGRFERFLFPALPSQNANIASAAKAVRSHGRDMGWTRLRGVQVYPAYLEALQEAARGLPGPLPMATSEMVLFAHAPRLAAGVLAKLPATP